MTKKEKWNELNKKIEKLNPLYEKLLVKITNIQSDIQKNPSEDKIEKCSKLIDLKNKYEETKNIMKSLSLFASKDENPDHFLQGLFDLDALNREINEIKTNLNEA